MQGTLVPAPPAAPQAAPPTPAAAPSRLDSLAGTARSSAAAAASAAASARAQEASAEAGVDGEKSLSASASPELRRLGQERRQHLATIRLVKQAEVGRAHAQPGTDFVCDTSRAPAGGGSPGSTRPPSAWSSRPRWAEPMHGVTWVMPRGCNVSPASA